MLKHILFGGALLVGAHRPVTEYKIDLDLPPEQRFLGILPHFNASVWDFYNNFFANDALLTDALYAISDKRGKEPDELQREIEGLASASKLPLKFVQGVQMLYELQTLMVPIVNFTGHNVSEIDPIPEEWSALSRIPWRGPGCTGIIALNKADGTVNHARNLDFSPLEYMNQLVYTGIFTTGGKEVFRSQMVAGYQSMITGMKMGPSGFAIERNTRYTDHVGGNAEMLSNLLGGRPLNGWTLRKILETAPDYSSATAAIATAKYVSTEYAIVSGVKQGSILSKSPEGVAYTQTLGQPNFGERDDYIIITNFDFFFHDVREQFDPTGGKVFRPRRIEAQRRLNASATLTPEVLFNVINADGVIADTIFQSVINVELGIWNVSQPF